MVLRPCRDLFLACSPFEKEMVRRSPSRSPFEKEMDSQAIIDYARQDSKQLKGPEKVHQLQSYLELLKLCELFSKNSFPAFLKESGFSGRNVLLKSANSWFLKPAFVMLRDDKSKCFRILIRGTRTYMDCFTALAAATDPFHISSLWGRAHHGMVAAARNMAEECTPILLKALEKNSDYGVKIFGHSLGGGTAALLTCLLREQIKVPEAITCVTFGTPACMTWELAESAKDFNTTIINGTDLIPGVAVDLFDDFCEKVIPSSSSEGRRDVGCCICTLIECGNALAKHAAQAVLQICFPTSNSKTDAANNDRLYPPGRILQTTRDPSSLNPGSNPGNDEAGERAEMLYDVSRDKYGVLEFSEDGIRDHDLKEYVKMMKLLIEQGKE